MAVPTRVRRLRPGFPSSHYGELGLFGVVVQFGR